MKKGLLVLAIGLVATSAFAGTGDIGSVNVMSLPIKGTDGNTYVEALCWGTNNYTKYSPLKIKLETYSENLKSYVGYAIVTEAVSIQVGAADLGRQGVFTSIKLMADEQSNVSISGINQNVITVSNGITEVSCALKYN